jgi:hypothetical protein
MGRLTIVGRNSLIDEAQKLVAMIAAIHGASSKAARRDARR